MKNLFLVSIIIVVFVLTLSSCQEQEIAIPGLGTYQVVTYFTEGEGVIAYINPSNGLVIEKVSTVPASSASVWIEGNQIRISAPVPIKEISIDFSWKNFPGGKIIVSVGNFFKKPGATWAHDSHGTGFVRVESGDLIPMAGLAPPKIPSSFSFLVEGYSVSLGKNGLKIVDTKNPNLNIVSTFFSANTTRQATTWSSLGRTPK